MSKSRGWLFGGVVAALASLLAGWLFVVSPQRARAAELSSQADQMNSANASLVTQIAQLKHDFADLPASQAQLLTYNQRIPSTAAMSSLLRQISLAGTASHVAISAIAPASLSGQGVGSAGASSGLLASNLSITLTGRYAAVEAFLTRIEGLQRAMLVTGLSLSKAATSTGPASGPATNAGDPQALTVTITGRVFVSSGLPAQASGIGTSAGAAATSGKIS